MAELVKVRGLNRKGVRIGSRTITNGKTVVVDLDDAITRRDVSRHSTLGALVVVGDSPAAVTTAAGLAVTAGTTTTVSSAAGTVLREDGASIAYTASNNQTVTAADATNPRIDLVSRPLAGGALTVTAGTAAASPVPPLTPANNIAVATVRVPANASASTQYTITDVAPRLA